MTDVIQPAETNAAVALAPATHWVRNLEIGGVLERFLVAAASTFLLIRIYLALTDYPQIGGHGLHIAHMLWGGLGMLVAVILLLSFLGGRVRAGAAVLGGAGFGAFIDELGKFITSDNNYFFQPTVAIIYIIFVIMFLSFQALAHRQVPGERARIAQELDAVVTALITGFTPAEREQALTALAQAPDDPLARNVAAIITRLAPPSPQPVGWGRRLLAGVRNRYRVIVRSQQLVTVAVIVMGIQALVGIGGVLLEITLDPVYSRANLNLTIGDYIKIGATGASYLCIIAGLLTLRRNRSAALTWFKRAVLVTIFVVQLFSFYDAGLGAAVGLAVNLVILAALNVALAEESAAPAATASAVRAATAGA